MIIDGHAHILEAEYGNIENLINIYKTAGIDKGVIVPGGMLNVKIMTRYVTGSIVPNNAIPNNQLLSKILMDYPDKFYAYYCVDPSKGESILHEFHEAIKKGFSGLKLSPMSHQFSLTSPVVKELAALCGDLHVPFYTHILFNPAANAAKIQFLAKEFPNTNFIVGHMGFGPSDVDLFEYAGELNNIYMETSTANILAISEAIKIAGIEKIIFGSEFPLSHPGVELYKIRMLKLSNEEFELVTSLNLIKLLNK